MFVAISSHEDRIARQLLRDCLTVKSFYHPALVIM